MNEAPGVKLRIGDGDVYIYLRGALGVSPIAPQAIEYPVRLEFWSSGIRLGVADFDGLSAMFAGQPVPRESVRRRVPSKLGQAVREALRRELPNATDDERSELFRRFHGYYPSRELFVWGAAYEHLPPGFGWLLDPWKIEELQPRLEQTLGATLWSCPADDGGVFGFTAGPSAPRA